MSIDIPNMPPPSPAPMQRTPAQVLRHDWMTWGFRLSIMAAFATAGWIGNRVTSELDKYGPSILEMQIELKAFQRSINEHITWRDRELAALNTTLKDHEDRLRQDREILVTHGTTIQNEASRLLSIEQRLTSSRP